MNLPHRATVALRAVDLANHEAHIKVVEVGGNNRGKNVLRYLADAGISFAAPWCASFVTWCLHKSGWQVGAGRGPDPFNLAYCPSWEQAATDHRFGMTIVPLRRARRGDVALFDFNRVGYAVHIGFIRKSFLGGRLLWTVEGNTQPEAGSGDQTGASGGDGVFKRIRRGSDVRRVIRINA